MIDFAQADLLSEQTQDFAWNRDWWWQGLVLLLLLGWIYSSILLQLAKQWMTDPNCSHGFFVPAFSLFMLWQARFKIRSMPRVPSAIGLLIVILALCVLAIGVLGAELFLSRISLLFLVAGLLIYFQGWSRFRAILFPWAFLFLMIPIPAILFHQITFPLQLLASKVARLVLPALGVPVLREGNVIHLPTMPLEVAEACSGIRSLLSLLTLSVAYSYLRESRTSIRILLALASALIAVAANALRIVGTGLLVQYWDPALAQGFYHILSGWLTFVVSVGMLFLFHGMLRLAADKL